MSCVIKFMVLANEYTLLRTHCCAHIVADTNVSPFARLRKTCCGHKFGVRETKKFLILFRNILCPQQMFPSLRNPRNIISNNVSTTMCPLLPVPLGRNLKCRSIAVNAVCKLEQLNNFSVYYSLFTHRLQRYVILNVFSNADQLTL